MYASRDEQDAAIRSYAAGETPLATLRRNGLDDYFDILQRLGEFGLRPPVAPLDGPHAELRARARALIADRLRRG